MSVEVHDHTRCLLGEGAFWHPARRQFYWCDILSRRVLTREGGTLRSYEFDRFVSALGWVDETQVIVATDRDLTLLDLDSGAQTPLVPLEPDTAITRSNDGRADPAGGFWIGTMGLGAETGAGSIWRYHRGEVTQLLPSITIPNAISFAPDGQTAYFTDTPSGEIRRWRIDAEGWPVGAPETAFAVPGEGGPDGAVVDAEGRIWIARWGRSQVTCHDPASGEILDRVALPAAQITCPAFGDGALYVTSAAIGLDEPTLTQEPGHGRTFRVPTPVTGQPEHRIHL
ncbi:SMP-30/gluconolactonase/LRE family protein [Palleronia caenipelagi]|uniref:SMP-30/gluconolactonase/LRE family protein n=1 Tax=Palleronia caenipelagi TaxID=2489174 RepID=A0A547Q8T6_9RHOB|nr:SMP-30/gluconolactonase/LRE family protein [Palleronia caenipelagi]TRD22807.1 SMP-30/gluconolactonase/LRE family protein [Palleronia caenipelagi]